MQIYFSGVFGTGFGKYGGHYAYLDESLRKMRDECHLFSERYTTLTRSEVPRAIKLENASVVVDQCDVENTQDYAVAVTKNKDIVVMASLARSSTKDKSTADCAQRFLKHNMPEMFPYFIGDSPQELAVAVEQKKLISVQGITSIKAAQRKYTLNRLFSQHLCDTAGHVMTKVHLSNAPSIDLLTHFPFVSASTNLWQTIGSAGDIFLPSSGTTLGVSSDHSAIGVHGAHINTVSEMERHEVLGIIKKAGVDFNLLSAHVSCRWAFNMWSITDYLIGAQHGLHKPLEKQQDGLF